MKIHELNEVQCIYLAGIVDLMHFSLAFKSGYTLYPSITFKVRKAHKTVKFLCDLFDNNPLSSEHGLRFFQISGRGKILDLLNATEFYLIFNKEQAKVMREGLDTISTEDNFSEGVSENVIAKRVVFIEKMKKLNESKIWEE